MSTRDSENDNLNPGAWDDSSGHRAHASNSLSEAEQDTFDDAVSDYSNSYDNTEEARSYEKATQGNVLSRFEQNFINETAEQTNIPGIKGIGKKLSKGPMAAIVSALLTVALAVAVFFINPAIALSAMTNAVTNTFDTASIANRAWLYKILANKFYDARDRKTEAACQANPSSTRCKRGTVTDEDAKKLQKNKSMRITFADGDYGGRKHIKKIELLNTKGEVVSTAQSRTDMKLLTQQAKMRSLINKSFHPSSGPKNTSRISKLIDKLWGVSRSDVMKNAKKKDELRKEFTRVSKLPESGDGEGSTRRQREDARQREADKVSSKAEAAGRKVLNKLKNPAAALCMGYYGAKAIMAVAAIDYYTKLGNFAMTYFRESDRARAGDGQQDVIQWLMDKLNYTEYAPEVRDGEPNRYYHTTGFDSEGMKYVFNKDAVGLSRWSKRYVFGDNLGALNEAISAVETTAGGAKNVFRACRTVNSIIGCAGMGPVSAIACIGMGLPIVGQAVGAVISSLIAPFITPVVAFIINKMMNAPIDDSVKGIDAGDVIAAGGGLVLTHVALNGGGLVLSKAGYRGFLAETNSMRNDMISDEVLAAKETPFDMYNQYSFLGSITQSAYQYGIIGPGSGLNLGTFSRILSLPTLAMSNLTKSASAAKQGYSQPMHGVTDDAQVSEDCPFLQDIGAGALTGCVPTTGYDTRSLSVEVNDVIDFMENGNYVDEEGAPTDSDAGKKYKNYVDFCQNGDMLIGATAGDEGADTMQSFFTGGLAGPDITTDWASRYNCTWGTDGAPQTGGSPATEGPNGAGENGATSQELAMFSAFSGQGMINDAIADEDDSGSGGSSESSEPTGDLGFPVKNAQTISSCNGLRPALSDIHHGIDIAGPDGTDILAADNGTVEVAEQNDGAPYTGYGKTVVIKHSEDLYTRYSHLQSIEVTQGAAVKKGDVIAKQGGSGSAGPNSYPSHLDFGVANVPTVPNTPESYNPMKYLTIPEGVTNPHGCSADRNGEEATKDDPRNNF